MTVVIAVVVHSMALVKVSAAPLRATPLPMTCYEHGTAFDGRALRLIRFESFSICVPIRRSLVALPDGLVSILGIEVGAMVAQLNLLSLTCILALSLEAKSIFSNQ